MKLMLALSAAMLASPAIAEELTIERLVASPSLNGPTVQGLRMSPDGRRITFLRGKDDNQAQLDLWEFDVSTGQSSLLVDSATLLDGEEEELSEEEKARRERNRSLTGKSGIVSYFWSNDSQSLLFPLGGDVFVLPLGGSAKQLTDTPEYETDIKFSPKGSYVSFIRNREIHVVNVETGEEKKLTEGASETVANGMAEFVAQEELGRYTGYWWSPDEAYIAYQQFDESPVEIKDRYEIQPDGSVISRKQRYPSAGTNNVTWDLKFVDVQYGGGYTALLPDHKNEQGFNEYLARVHWNRDSDKIIVETLNRAQDTLTYSVVNDQGGISAVFQEYAGNPHWVRQDMGGRDAILQALRLESDVWINIYDDFHDLGDSKALVTRDWDQGDAGAFKHILLMDYGQGTFTPITSGEWVVDAIEQVDEEAGIIYFTGFKDSPLEKHLYRVPIDGGDIERITREKGWHDVTVGDGVFVDRFSHPDQPPQIVARHLKDGTVAATILANNLDTDHPFAPYMDGRVDTSFGTLRAEDGTELHYRMYRPAVLEEGKKYPAVMAPYGGPHGQRVRQDWRLDFNHILARKGYVVMVVDNRGMWNRGLAFEGHVKNAMGTVEIADQVSAANFLKTQGYVDGDNIGFWGWSYGGYMTLMALFQAPDVFKAGVSVAPVTDWRLYDTAYTERYLGLPSAPGDVYENSSVFKYIDGFKGKLLLIHGMADDNVFFDNSVKLMAALQDQGKAFELMTYPGKKHGIRGEAARGHLYRQALDFFERTLKD